jgi:hypothetical protein
MSTPTRIICLYDDVKDDFASLETSSDDSDNTNGFAGKSLSDEDESLLDFEGGTVDDDFHDEFGDDFESED